MVRKNIAAEAGCPVEMGPERSKCGRPLHNAPQGSDNDRPVCLMHSDDPNKASGEFFDTFWREFDLILEAAGENEAHFEFFWFPKLDLVDRRFEAFCRFQAATFAQGADFQKATFVRGADFQKATFTLGANFRGATFTLLASFFKATFTHEADFSEATFAQDANFFSAIFTQEADFSEATFTQDANFFRATFTQEADFSEATFAQDANFFGATFTQQADFREATFRRTANFPLATFTQDADFPGATFRQDADFGGATFTQRASFFKAIFTKNADFGRATFTQDADFEETEFRRTAKWGAGRFLESATFRRTKFDPQVAGAPSAVFALASFSEPGDIVFDDVDLSRALFHNCDVSEVWFTSSVRWAKRGSHGDAIFEEFIPLDQEYARGLERDSERDYRAVAQIYQQLKKNYDTRLDYWTANEFHFGEMEMKRRVTPNGRHLLGLRRWVHRWLSLTAWYSYASDYGNSYGKPIVWLLAVLLLFAGLFPLPHFGLRRSGFAENETYGSVWRLGSSAMQHLKGETKLVGKSMLVAVDMATFQRNPEYVPAYPGGRVLAIVEALLTSTLFALFLLAIRRQFRR